jgi:RHS repeat-associated protein
MRYFQRLASRVGALLASSRFCSVCLAQSSRPLPSNFKVSTGTHPLVTSDILKGNVSFRMSYSVRRFTRFIAALSVIVTSQIIVFGYASAQTAAPSDLQVDSGTHPYSSYDGDISLMSGNLSFCVPLVSLPGRKSHDLTIPLCYNSEFNEVETTASGSTSGLVWDTISVFPWVWGSSTPEMGPGWTLTARPAVYTSENSAGGTVVFMPDGSKYSMASNDAMDSTSADIALTTSALYLKDGTEITPAAWVPNSNATTQVIDTAGNTITYTPSSVTDSVGRVVNVSATNAAGTTPASLVFQYPDSNGTATTTVQFLSATYNCSQNPAGTPGPGPFGASGTYSMPSAVILPDGLSYTFQYDGCGHLLKAIYPDGGYTRYTYTPVPTSVWGPGFVAGGSWARYPYIVNQVTAKYACTVPSSTGPGDTCSVAELETTYTPTAIQTDTNNEQNVVVDPLGNETVYQFSQQVMAVGSWLPAVETMRAISGPQQTSEIIATTYNTHSAAGNPYPLVPISRTTTLNNGMVSEVDWNYAFREISEGDSPMTEKLEYDYGAGSHGALLRQTNYSWLQTVDPNTYKLNGIFVMDRKVEETVYNGSGTMVADTINQYGPFVDISQVQKWSSTNNAYLTTQYAEGQYGNIIDITDPNGNVTSYSYTDNYTDGVNRSSNAFPTQITYPATANGAAHAVKKQYYWGSGLVAASCGENFSGTCATGGTSGADYTSYSYDVMGHTTSATTGDGGSTTTCHSEIQGGSCYSASYPLTIVSTEAIASGVTTKSTTVLDGLGRATQTQLDTDPSCSSGSLVTTTYDADGRVSTKSNPYCSTSDPTYGVTTESYDALNRIVKITNPDNTTTTNTYTGRAILSADEGNGTVTVEHISQKDALGRLTAVCEVSGTTQQGSSNNTPSSCGLDVSGSGFLTSYSYDALGDLTSVAQGSISRSFSYDSLKRLRSATNPESGTTTYAYDLDGNLTGKTSALGITTTYTYDALNRLTGKSYSDGATPAACFQYDQGTNADGRLSTEWTQAEACSATPPTSGLLTERKVAAYDLMGRIATDEQCSTPGNCTGSINTVNYEYNRAGDVAGFTNGLTGTSAMAFSNTYDSAGRLSTMVGPTTAGTSSEPVNLFTADSYNATGAIVNAQYGTGIGLQRAYNKRLLPISETDLTATTPGTATIQITGAEQTSGASTATITFTGSEQSMVSDGETVYDGGLFIVSINGTITNGGSQYQIEYNQGSTPQTLATNLAEQMGGCAFGPVNAVAAGATVTLTSCTSGTNVDYSISAVADGHSSNFASYSFAVTTSGATMVVPGATFANGTILIDPTGDTGISVLEVFFKPSNSGTGPASIGVFSTSTASAAASEMVAAIPSCAASGGYFSAAANGPVITLTSCTAGFGGNAPLQVSGGGGSGSFTMTPSGSTLTGGINSTGVYDSGTVNLTVNGMLIASAPYDAGSTPTSIATALVASGSSNSLVTLSSSGANLTMTAKDDGTVTDYTYQLSTAYNTASFTQPSFSASSTSGDLEGGSGVPLYSWAINSYAPDGDVLTVTDSVMGTWSYGYDDMNRLVKGDQSSGIDLSWSYDRYGNRWAQAATGSGSAVQTSFTFSGNNNRIDQYSSNYDADGNLHGDGLNTYAYDAENRIVTLNGNPTYIYDAEGRRVAKYSGGSISAIYILGLGGAPITETNGSGVWAYSNVFTPAGKLLATYEGPGGSAVAGYHYNLTDWLGTKRLQTNTNGNEDEACVSYPFGDGLSCSGPHATDASDLHFTGKERDAESGLDYFGARYLSSNFGRFVTPDWAAAPTDVPYAKFGDPQSLNLYAYVGNNPNTAIDLDGHDGVENKGPSDAVGIGGAAVIGEGQNEETGIAVDSIDPESALASASETWEGVALLGGAPQCICADPQQNSRQQWEVQNEAKTEASIASYPTAPDGAHMTLTGCENKSCNYTLSGVSGTFYVYEHFANAGVAGSKPAGHGDFTTSLAGSAGGYPEDQITAFGFGTLDQHRFFTISSSATYDPNNQMSVMIFEAGHDVSYEHLYDAAPNAPSYVNGISTASYHP